MTNFQEKNHLKFVIVGVRNENFFFRMKSMLTKRKQYRHNCIHYGLIQVLKF